MSQQLSLLGEPVERPRAPRQDAVLELLAQHPDGVSVDEAGAAAHASAGKHNPDSICKWCGPDGRAILRSLERKGLVRRTGNGQFTLKTVDVNPPGMTDEIPY